MPDLDTLSASDTQIQAFRGPLMEWYDDNKREMPWRKTGDPYRIWVSEIMLQQTRVDTVRDYYRRFVDAFPTVEDLADAEQDDVLKLWEGLGYYSRARYLHHAAGQVVSEHDGTVPRDYDAIRDLKGIGPYTAAAVLSIAYNEPHPVLDGNVMRVISRVFASDANIKKAKTQRHFRRLAGELLEPERAGDFNQAMMELGATICTPTSPSCEKCPVQRACSAYDDGNPEQYPVTPESKPVPHHDIAVGLVFDDDGRILIQRRPEDGLLGGLWEFPGGKAEEAEQMDEACVRELREELGIEVEVDSPFYTLSHAYSHFKITLYAFRCRLVKGEPTSEEGQPIRWVDVSKLDDYAFPRANRKLIEELDRRQDAPSLFD